MLSAMWKLSQMELPRGPAYNKLETLVAGIRMAKTFLKAVEAEEEKCADCFTIETLVNNLYE